MSGQGPAGGWSWPNVPVNVQGLTDVNTNLVNIQRSLSGLLQTIATISITTNFVVNAAPFLNNGTVSAAGTITAATLAATSLIGNATGAGAIPTAIPVAAPLGFNAGGSLALGTIVADTLLGNANAIGAIPAAVPISSSLTFSAGTLGFSAIAATSLLGNATGGAAVPTALLVSGSLSFIAGALNAPTALPPNGAAGGDLGATYPNPTVLQVHGVTTNSSAAAGLVGEYISSTVLVGAAVALTTATPATVTSISLTAGDWDVSANVAFNPAAGTTITVQTGGISTTAATLPVSPGAGAYATFAASFTASASDVFPVGVTRLSLAGTTTVYLVAQASFGTSTMGAYGFIGARRAR